MNTLQCFVASNPKEFHNGPITQVQDMKSLKAAFQLRVFSRACTHGKVQIFLNFIQVLITLTNTH